mmetsp:Transcript_24539/g.76435  ORF Transcript_24539/g.76435 Transcript_24539/m.76435 type:complete len:80 (+) Transcript_24539:88-327(+)
MAVRDEISSQTPATSLSNGPSKRWSWTEIISRHLSKRFLNTVNFCGREHDVEGLKDDSRASAEQVACSPDWAFMEHVKL